MNFVRHKHFWNAQETEIVSSSSVPSETVIYLLQIRWTGQFSKDFMEYIHKWFANFFCEAFDYPSGCKNEVQGKQQYKGVLRDDSCCCAVWRMPHASSLLAVKLLT